MSNNQTDSSFTHNHKNCIKDALSNAEEYCHTHGLRLTELRKKVLEYIWQTHNPSAAYDILSQLANDGYNASPPTVYRSLDFLLKHHMIHRIASLNAYVGCSMPSHTHSTQFFLCEQCGIAIELDNPSIHQSILVDSKQLGFKINNQTIEISGVCNACQQ